MEPYLIEWSNMLLRWLHITAAIAWIGSSFFFMHLDASLRADPSIKVGGSAWQVHGGGFYQMKKFFVAPDHLPTEITWHKWQSYWTWISGFFLLVVIYYAQSTLYLIDPAVMALSGIQASALGIGSLVIGWLVYDQLCKSPLGKSDNLLAIAGFGFVIAMSWFYTQVFSGRGALIHSGALMATIMTGNVALNIIPNQRKVIAMLEKGETPDPSYGKQAKQRSGHNNYITLPVLFMMISNHYPIFWTNSSVIPLTVFLIIIAGAIIRHFYNIRHANHKKSPYWAWGVATVALLIAFVLSLTTSPVGRSILNLSALDLPNLALAEQSMPPDSVVDIVVSRCSMCHAAEPVWEGVHIAPKGVMLNTPEHIAHQAEAIRIWAVLTRAMPPNNLTEITQEERDHLAEWLRDRQG